MKKHSNKAVFWGILLTELSHVFCCVLPMLFSLASLLATFGLVVMIPPWLEAVHELMHEWELHALVGAGFMLVFGWALHLHSYKQDCHDHGCEHEPCTPRKNKTSLILKIATVLFIVNIIVFFGFHGGLDRLLHIH